MSQLNAGVDLTDAEKAENDRLANRTRAASFGALDAATRPNQREFGPQDHTAKISAMNNHALVMAFQELTLRLDRIHADLTRLVERGKVP